MGENCNIVVNGVEFVPKKEIMENYVIVRTYSAGVFAGELVGRDKRVVTLRNARRLWYWDGAASLSQLAMEGVKKPENCKFPCEVEEIVLTEAIEVITATRECFDSIKGVTVWRE